MELLKAALIGTLQNSEECMKDDQIELEVFLSQKYTMKELYFLLTNHKQPYHEYIKICFNAGVLPVPIEDCPAILDYFENYTCCTVYIDQQSYSGNRDYSFILDMISNDQKGILTNEVQNYIVVPENIRSPLNIKNIKEFIVSGTIDNIDIEELIVADENTEIILNDRKFIVVNTIERFTSEDWNNIACIFLDGTMWQFKQWTRQGLVEIFEKIPCFYVYFKNQYSTKLQGYNVKELIVDDESRKLMSEVDFCQILQKN